MRHYDAMPSEPQAAYCGLSVGTGVCLTDPHVCCSQDMIDALVPRAQPAGNANIGVKDLIGISGLQVQPFKGSLRKKDRLF